MNQRNDSAIKRFDRYLKSIVSRETFRLLLAATVRVLVVLAGITVLAMVCAHFIGYTEWLLNMTRIAFVLSPMLIFIRYFWQPLHRLRYTRGAQILATAHDGFGERLQTYLELKQADRPSAFTPLLAEDNAAIAAQLPVQKAIPRTRLAAPMLLLLLLGGGIAAFFFTENDWRQNDVKHLWAGWLKDGYIPPRDIAVSPGNQTVLWGSDVDIEAVLSGFASDTVTLTITPDNEPAATTVLYREPSLASTDSAVADSSTGQLDNTSAAGGDRFGFSLFRVIEPVTYSVSTAYTASEIYTIDVVKPATVLSINARLVFPGWAQLSDAALTNIDRLQVVTGTEATFEIVTDGPLAAGALLLGEQRVALLPHTSVVSGNTPTNPAAQNLSPETLDQTAAQTAGQTVNQTAGQTVNQTADKTADQQGNPDTAQPVAASEQSVLAADGNGQYRYLATVTIDRDTTLSVIDHLVTQDVTLVDRLAVRLLADRPPEIQFVSPGRDISATPIEEVTVTLEASDDFAVESLSLFYSVNAGDWREITLPVDQTSHTHTFMLENLGDGLAGNAEISADTTEGDNSTVELVVAPLQPGDLIAYYASVSDRSHALDTDMMLIDVRPFEKRYSQSQGASGGGEGQADDSGEISKRQREILIATWNLLRAQENAVDGDDLAGNAGLLSDLQLTLFDQANKLAERTEARALTSQGDDIREFVALLRLAAAGMQTSSELLNELDFEAAIQPQQKTLQYLQQAEAIFSDFSVNNEPSDGEGGGGAGQDIAEMFELEMDLSRNQYEEPESASERQTAAEALESVFDQLAELSRRQLALEERIERSPETELSEEERWQQEQLQREAEAIKRQLEQLQRDSAGGQQANSDSGAEDAASEGSEAEQRDSDAGAEPESGDSNQQDNQSDEFSELADATDSLERALESNDLSQTARLTQQALDALSDERSQRIESQLSSAADRVGELLRQQRRSERELREAAKLQQQANQRGDFTRSLTNEDARELADGKRELQRELNEITDSLRGTASSIDEALPETAQLLDQALDDFSDSEAAVRLGIAADDLEEGQLATLLPSESLATNAIRNLRDQLSDAASRAGTESPVENRLSEEERLANALESLAELRTLLRDESVREGNNNTQTDNRQQTTQPNEPQSSDDQQGEDLQGEDLQGEGQQGEGQQGEGQQGEGQQGRGQQGQGQQGQGQQGQDQQGQGQQGQGQQGEGQQGEGQQGEGQQSQQGQGQRGLAGQSTGGTPQFRDRTDQRASAEVSERLEALTQSFESLGIEGDVLNELRDSARRLGEGAGGTNGERIEATWRQALERLEQLELSLTQPGSSSSPATRALKESLTGDYEQPVVDYFKNLSEEPDS